SRSGSCSSSWRTLSRASGSSSTTRTRIFTLAMMEASSVLVAQVISAGQIGPNRANSEVRSIRLPSVDAPRKAQAHDDAPFGRVAQLQALCGAVKLLQSRPGVGQADAFASAPVAWKATAVVLHF